MLDIWHKKEKCAIDQCVAAGKVRGYVPLPLIRRLHFVQQKISS